MVHPRLFIASTHLIRFLTSNLPQRAGSSDGIVIVGTYGNTFWPLVSGAKA